MHVAKPGRDRCGAGRWRAAALRREALRIGTDGRLARTEKHPPAESLDAIGVEH